MKLVMQHAGKQSNNIDYRMWEKDLLLKTDSKLEKENWRPSEISTLKYHSNEMFQ